MATTTVPTARGEITTSDGTVLAMTVQTDQVTADPPQISVRPPTIGLVAVAAKLAGPLRMKKAAILRLLRHPTSIDYVLLKQSVDVTTADAISKLELVGIYLTPTYTRVYPGGDLAAGLLGFTNQNKATGVITGEAGLELAYNRLLTGRSGLLDEEIDPSGQIPNTTSTVRKPVPAGNLRLTIQSDIQWEAEQECAKQVRLTKAKNCSVIVIQPRTGRILALAQYPTFNPGGPITSLAQTTDLPVQEVFAPGSTAKVITAAAAFQYAGETPRTSYTVPDALFWHGAWYRDAETAPEPALHDRGHHRPLAERRHGAGRPARHARRAVRRVPCVRPRPVHRAQPAGGVRRAAPAGHASGPVTIATSGTRSRSARASTSPPCRWPASTRRSRTAACGSLRRSWPGTPPPPASTSRRTGRPRRRVIPAKTARELLSALEQVPLVYQRGGEPWGIIKGYTVAAKTGTAQEQDNTYGSSFIGIAPADEQGRPRRRGQHSRSA